MPTKSGKSLNTIKTYRMSPVLACKLNKLSMEGKISESQLVRDILNRYLQESGL
jgi:hypothetical protein